MTRREIAEGVLAQLRGVGPQTVAQIQDDLCLTKLQVTSAIYDLMNRDQVEYDYPARSPMSYKAVGK